MNTALIIPIYNGEHYLDQTVKELSLYCADMTWVFVDDGSTDKTKEKLTALQTTMKGQRFFIVSHEQNKGKGAAIVSGVQYLQNDIHAYNVVVFTDVELPYGTKAIIKANQAICHKRAKVAIGVREDMTHKYSIYRRFGRSVFRLFLPKMIRHMKDTQCGLKAFDMRVLTNMIERLQTLGWVFDVELMVMATQNKLPIVLVDVALEPHIEVGKGGVTYMKNGPRVCHDLYKINRAVAKGVYVWE